MSTATQPYTYRGRYEETYAPAHPLAAKSGLVFSHRIVLYAKLGPGSHPCHWCERILEWGVDLHTDHLDDDHYNHDPEMLVATCRTCNIARANGKLEGRLRKIVGRWQANRARLVALGHWQYVIAHVRQLQESPPRLRGLTSPKVRDIRKRFADGEPISVLAKEHGVDPQTVRKAALGTTWAWLPGAVPQADEALRSSWLRRFTSEQEALIAQAYAAGSTLQRLADEHGCAQATIRTALQRQGMPARPNRGENAGGSRFDDATIMSIRNAYAAGGVSYHDLAKTYGGDFGHIGAIVRGEIWTHLPVLPPPPPKPRARYRDPDGYVHLNDARHPIATASGGLPEHRAVLYAKLNGQDAPCHWCERPLTWKVDLDTDHLNSVRDDNAPDNLVPSCAQCNSARAAGRLTKRLRKRTQWRMIMQRLDSLGHLQYIVDRPQVERRVDTYHTMTVPKVREIRRRFAEGETQTALAREFGLSVPSVHFIVRRKTWAWLT